MLPLLSPEEINIWIIFLLYLLKTYECITKKEINLFPSCPPSNELFIE
ncbi:hypothetical protein NEOC65_002447 [Neochlamydia sp. AcF65]|nr:hypothetical protein [Neochlamydia sp. AcF65]